MLLWEHFYFFNGTHPLIAAPLKRGSLDVKQTLETGKK